MKAGNQLPRQMSCVMVLVKATLSKRRARQKPAKPQFRLIEAVAATQPREEHKPRGQHGDHDQL